MGCHLLCCSQEHLFRSSNHDPLIYWRETAWRETACPKWHGIKADLAREIPANSAFRGPEGGLIPCHSCLSL